MRRSVSNNLWSIAGVILTLVASGAAPSPAFAGCSDDPGPGVDWSDCRKRNLILSGDNLERANLAGTDFNSTDLSGAKLDMANLAKAQLSRTRMRSVSAKRAIFAKASGGRTDFNSANLEQADFNRAEFSRSNFARANLVSADFNRSDLGRAIFTEAILSDPDFGFANLARADFRGAKITGTVNVEGAFLFNTRLEGMDLTIFQGLKQWQVNMICGDDETRLGDQLTKPDDWSCSNEE